MKNKYALLALLTIFCQSAFAAVARVYNLTGINQTVTVLSGNENNPHVVKHVVIAPNQSESFNSWHRRLYGIIWTSINGRFLVNIPSSITMTNGIIVLQKPTQTIATRMNADGSTSQKRINLGHCVINFDEDGIVKDLDGNVVKIEKTGYPT